MPGQLNRGAIVTAGLQLGGNPGLTTRANEYLNIFLDHLYRSFDWEFLLKEASVSSGSPKESFSLPADYSRVRSVHIDGQDRALIQTNYDDIWRRIRFDNYNSQTSGNAPTHFGIETGTPKGYWWPVPTTSAAGKILYYYLPAAMTADTDVPTFPHSLALVEAVATYVEAYERESLQLIIERTTGDILRRYANAHFDAGRSNANVVQLDRGQFGGWNFRES